MKQNEAQSTRAESTQDLISIFYDHITRSMTSSTFVLPIQIIKLLLILLLGKEA